LPLHNLPELGAITVKIFRIFLKPEGRTWCDYPMQPDQTVAQVLGMWRVEGMLVTDQWVAPLDAMLFGAVLEQVQISSSPPWKPSVVPFAQINPEPPKPAS
jgi:hypothetical protein